MIIDNPASGEHIRAQGCTFVQAVDGSGNPQSLADAVADGLGGGSGSTRTPTLSTITGDGTVAAGKKYIEFILSSDFAGTIKGATIDPAILAIYSLPLLPGADTYAAIAYTISAGSALLTTIA